MVQRNSDVWSLKSRDVGELAQKLRQNVLWYSRYEGLNAEWRERFQDFCLRKKTLPITYDPFFKRIFNPDIHPDRLSRFISSMVGERVEVVEILPNEESMLAGGMLLIMDVLVRLADGALANVEVQKVPYLFPGERISCYSADLVLRQYSRVKGAKGNAFNYGDLRKVYTIVFFEKSTSIFHEKGMHYLHHGKTVFDTGLKMELLQEYCLVALDVFKEKLYPRDRSEQTAWIAFLATDSLRQAEELVAEFPWLEEVYAEMEEFLQKPEEVLNMYSEALKIMDLNTVQFMIEQQQQELDEANKRLDETQGKLHETQGKLDETQGKLDEAQGKLDETQGKLDEAQGKLDKSIAMMVSMCQEHGESRESIMKKLQEAYDVDANEAKIILARLSVN